MLRKLSSLLVMVTTTKANAVGFASGNNFTATPIQGRVEVVCNGFNGSSSAIYNCRDVVLDPKAYDYFVGPKAFEADRVELTASHQDGSSRSKTSSYDGERGISRDAFNLWISTLFQRPLLETGKNIISYRIYSRDHLIEVDSNNEFVVNVTKGSMRVCPDARYASTDVNDCNSQYSICQKYFDEFRNCL